MAESKDPSAALPITLAEMFDSYRRKVIPVGASAVQVQECERAFIAAAFMILTVLRDVVGHEDVPEDVGLHLLAGLLTEAETFGRTATNVRPPDVQYTVADPLDVKSTLLRLSQSARAAIPPGWGFLLMIFEFGAGGSNFYASNADRADVIGMLREYIARQTQ